jgi:hypothetical protein
MGFEHKTFQVDDQNKRQTPHRHSLESSAEFLVWEKIINKKFKA